MFQEAGAKLAQVWVLFVEFLLQGFYKLFLTSVNVLDVTKDCLQLFLCKHVSSFAALLNVPLKGGQIRKACGVLALGLIDVNGNASMNATVLYY